MLDMMLAYATAEVKLHESGERPKYLLERINQFQRELRDYGWISVDSYTKEDDLRDLVGTAKSHLEELILKCVGSDLTGGAARRYARDFAQVEYVEELIKSRNKKAFLRFLFKEKGIDDEYLFELVMDELNGSPHLGFVEDCKDELKSLMLEFVREKVGIKYPNSINLTATGTHINTPDNS